MANCLTQAVILREIFGHISNPELLKLSFVNKLWNYEARIVMKNRGNLVAGLKFHDNQPCQEYLDAFAADLLRMNVIPFSGIRIQLGHCKRACEIPAPYSTYLSILDELPLKNVTVALAGEYSENRCCPGSILARTALKQLCGVLEEVSLLHIGLPKYFERPTKILVFIQDCTFPNLKILKLGENYERGDQTYVTELLRALVNRSPKLQELHVNGPISLMLDVLEGSSTLLVLPTDVVFDQVPEHAIDRIRLEYLHLRYKGPNSDIDMVYRIPRMLLQTFSSTLHSIEMDAFLAVALMSYGIRLDKVSFLSMSINYTHLEQFEPRVLRTLKQFDFTRIFPNLDKVLTSAHFAVGWLSPDHRLVERATAALREPKPDRAINIKELDLYYGTISVNNVEFYAEMFPQIRRIQVLYQSREISFGSIWNHWVDLEELNVVVDAEYHVEGLDSAICGIFPEEVAELKQKDEEFLKKVNIVPVMPAMTCLKNLRKLALFLVPRAQQPAGFGDQEDFQPRLPRMFSRVTELVAFAKFPHLAVTLSNLCSVCFYRTFEPLCTCQ